MLHQQNNEQFDALSDAIAQYLAQSSEVMKRIDAVLHSRAPTQQSPH